MTLKNWPPIVNHHERDYQKPALHIKRVSLCSIQAQEQLDERYYKQTAGVFGIITGKSDAVGFDETLRFVPGAALLTST